MVLNLNPVKQRESFFFHIFSLACLLCLLGFFASSSSRWNDEARSTKRRGLKSQTKERLNYFIAIKSFYKKEYSFVDITKDMKGFLLICLLVGALTLGHIDSVSGITCPVVGGAPLSLTGKSSIWHESLLNEKKISSLIYFSSYAFQISSTE